MTWGQQVTTTIASWCNSCRKLYQQHKDLRVWTFQHKEVYLNCQTAALASTRSVSQGDTTASEDIHGAQNRTENRTKKVTIKKKKTNTCTQIPLDSWRNWLPLPHSLYNKKLLESFFPHLLFPFEFLREQLWTLRTEKWERQERRCFSSYDSKQMSLWTLPRQVRG